MTELRQSHPLRDLLAAAELPRSVYYYQRLAAQRPDRYADARQLIGEVFHRHQGRYGYRRIQLALGSKGCWLNHKTVQKLMGQLGLKSTVRPKRYKSYKGGVGTIAPNILQRDFEASRPNEKWVTDVTEFKVCDRKIYLSPILDLYNREIISWRAEESPKLNMVLEMVDGACQRLQDGEKPVLHSDQGWQYQMSAYQRILETHGMSRSMSRKGNCLDNSVIENFFGILKTEFFHGKQFDSLQAFKTGLAEYIHYYNHDRIKQKLKGLSPVEYRTQSFVAA